MNTSETLFSAVDECTRFEDVMMPLYEQWKKGEWGPKQEEILFALLDEHDAVFPWDSVPPMPAMEAGCAQYQAERCTNPSGDNYEEALSENPGSKLTYYRTRIQRMRDRRGQDLCWEVEGLFHALPTYTKHDDPERSFDQQACLKRCQLYRDAIAALSLQHFRNS